MSNDEHNNAAATPASGYAVAVVGATGTVGSALLTVLEERGFPVGELHLLGSVSSDEPETAVFANRGYRLGPLADFDFGRVALAFFCAPAAVAAQEVPRAVAAGCRVIDLSAQFRADPATPLVVPAINGDQLDADRALVASPSAAAVQAAAVLGPLQQGAEIARVAIHTQLSVSDRGRTAIAELAGQTARLLNAQGPKRSLFPAQIAFNMIAAFDDHPPGGYTEQEAAFMAELRKLLAAPSLPISASFAYAPVFYGHSQVIEVETRTPLTLARVKALLAAADGVKVLADKATSLSPVGNSAGSDAVIVGRIRLDAERGLITLWTVADNVRKGAAVNSVQIAETLLKPCA